MSMKLYSAIHPSFYPLNQLYPELQCVKIDLRNINKLQSPGILIIWGGADIHPSLYGRPNVKSYVTGDVPSLRDQLEAKLFALAVERQIPILGICRGAQLGCALSGGMLIQHVDGHEDSHRITTADGDQLVTSSLHHQMMYPWDVEHKLIAWSSIPQSKRYVGLTDLELSKIPVNKYSDGDLPQPIEPEIVWFPTTKCLAIQGHPEFLSIAHPFNEYMQELIDARMLT